MVKPTGGGGDGGKGESDLATRVQHLEERWQLLNSLPTNSDMFRRMQTFEQIEKELEDHDAEAADAAETVTEDAARPLCHPRQPMLELWHAIQLMNKVENNTAGITRVRLWQSLLQLVDNVSISINSMSYKHRISMNVNFVKYYYH